MITFDETKHPRDWDGKFTEKGIFYDEPSRKGKNKKKESLFGEEFTGYKEEKAIEKLLKMKKGHIKNAFFRKEIGGIDIVWGDEKSGLCHTIIRRDKLLNTGEGTISGIEMVKKIPEIIKKGKFLIGKNDRPNFLYKNFLVIIKPTFDGQKLNWVVTAMEIKKAEED